jgi:hypothetical protein
MAIVTATWLLSQATQTDFGFCQPFKKKEKKPASHSNMAIVTATWLLSQQHGYCHSNMAIVTATWLYLHQHGYVYAATWLYSHSNIGSAQSC